MERIYSTGEAIGPYRVERLLATGGSSYIYEAVPLAPLRSDLLRMGITRVVIKRVRLEALGLSRREQKRRVERLDREFRTLLQLSRTGHPNLVKVYDFGQDGDAPYYVMECVDGITLDDALAARPRLGQILHSFAQLCGAVALLHNAGIRHRDLKPSNVLVRKDGGAPVLIDFGLCLTLSERTLTGPQELLGPPWYVSPEYATHWLSEQAEPYLAAPTDDVWALGVMLFQVLTGAVPWQTPPTRREALLREIQHADVRHPSNVYPGAPRAVGDVVLRMLAPTPETRLQDASEALRELGKAAEVSDMLSPIAPRRSPRELMKKPRKAPRSRGHVNPPMLATVTGLFLLVSLGTLVARPLRHGVAPTDAVAGSTARPVPSQEANTTRVNGGTALAKTVLRALPLPQGGVPDQQTAPCPDGIEEINGRCWHKRPLSPAEVKAGACEYLRVYEPSPGWCRAHQAAYEPWYARRRANNVIDPQ